MYLDQKSFVPNIKLVPKKILCTKDFDFFSKDIGKNVAKKKLAKQILTKK